MNTLLTSYTARVTNIEVFMRAGIKKQLFNEMWKSKLKLFGHVTRSKGHRARHGWATLSKRTPSSVWQVTMSSTKRHVSPLLGSLRVHDTTCCHFLARAFALARSAMVARPASVHGSSRRRQQRMWDIA